MSAPVCDGEDRAFPELLADGHLQQVVRLVVDTGSGLIDAEYLGRSRSQGSQQHSVTGRSQELTL